MHIIANNFWGIKKSEIAGVVFLPVFFLTLLAIFKAEGVISYLHTLFLFTIANNFVNRKYQKWNYYSFHFFIALALLLFLANIVTFPNQQGLTGGTGSITDDTAYYLAATDVSRNTIQISGGADREELFIQTIRFLYPYKITDPINIVILNVLLGLAFIPHFTARVADVLFNNEKISKVAYKFILFCPLCWAGGLIIMKDVLCSLLIITAFYCFIRHKYIFFFLLFSYLTFLKFGFVLFLLVSVICYESVEIFCKKKGAFIVLYLLCFILAVFIGIYYILPNLEVITSGKMSNGELFREEMLSFFERYNSDSIFFKLFQLPIYLKIPSLTIAFLILPLFSLEFGYNSIEKVYIVRDLLYGTFFPIYIMIISKYVFECYFKYKRNSTNLLAVLWIVLFLAMALGMVSLQIRHKVAMMPFLYIAAAYGRVNSRNKKYTVLTYICLYILILLNVIYALIKL